MSEILRSKIGGYLAGLLGIVAVTSVAAPFHGALNDTAVALAYLLVVLLVATVWGSRPALVASISGVLCFNFFFLPPLYTFTIADPQNWVALGAFFATAVTAGQLSELAKRRAAEAEAIRTAARLTTMRHRSLLEASLDALVTIGPDGRVDEVNSAIETLTGRPREALIGSDFSTCFTDPDQARALYREVLRDGFVRDRPLELRHQDGHVTSVLYNAALHRDDRGKVIGVVAAARSISTSAGSPVVALSDPVVTERLRRFVVFSSGFSIVVGLLGLVGWTFDIGLLKGLPGQVVIKPNAAILLMLCGAALWLLRTTDGPSPRHARKALGQALAVAATLISGLSLTEHLVGWDLGIDQLLFRYGNAVEAFERMRPGLMAPLTALDFLVLSLALLWLDSTITYRARRYGPTPFLAFAANTGAIMGLLDCVLGSHTNYTHIALQTAVALFILSLAVAGARTGWGLGALLVSSSDGGLLTRRLWPAAIVVPLLIGAASWMAYAAGVFSEWAGISTMIVAMITLLAGLTVWSAQSLDRSDEERRRAEQSLHRREEELREAQRLARVGSWWWDPVADAVAWSEGLYRIAGRDPKLPAPGFKEHVRFFTPDSFARLDEAVERAVRTGASFALELDMVREDGAIRSVTSRGEAERDAAGLVVLVRGTIHDVTEHRRAEEALRQSEANLNKAQEIAHVGSWHLDLRTNRLTWSDEVFRIFGVHKGTALTYESFLASIYPPDRAIVEAAWSAAIRGEPYDVEHRILAGDAMKWVRERAKVEFDPYGRAVKGIGTVQDITERKRAQEEILRVNRALRALSLCNESLIRASEEAAWLERVCRIVVDEAGYRFCWVGRAERDPTKTVTAVARAGVDEGYLEAVGATWADTRRGRGPVGTCIRTRETQIVKNTSGDLPTGTWVGEAITRGYASILAIPLIVDGEPFGSLNIYATEVEAFSDHEVKLLSELASDLAFGIEALRTEKEKHRAESELRTLNAELEQRVLARTADLEAARDREAKIGFRIQQMLLLTQPPTDVPGIKVAALTIPSQRIDGDFYDFFRHEEQCLDVIVADVMGKGVPAALLAAATKSNVLEALCHLTAMSPPGQRPEPREIVTLAHADMVRQLIDLESFVTLSYARLDLAARHLDLVDCGHTGMVLSRARTGCCEVVHGTNLPLGIREGEIFEQVRIAFEPGDLFVFYSDGITELRNPQGELYGADRLAACVRDHCDLEPAALVDVIRTDAVAFARSDRLTDDLTCVAVKVGGAPAVLGRADTEITSDLTELRRARDFVREFCASIPPGLLKEDDVADFELAVNEAASNIMRHAYRGRSDQRIQLEADATPDCVCVRLHHLGESFDPSVVPPPALDGTRESGFGMYLIAKTVDHVQYSRDDRGRNCISLVKQVNPAAREVHDGPDPSSCR